MESTDDAQDRLRLHSNLHLQPSFCATIILSIVPSCMLPELIAFLRDLKDTWTHVAVFQGYAVQNLYDMCPVLATRSQRRGSTTHSLIG
jgi:hypothetical protein